MPFTHENFLLRVGQDRGCPARSLSDPAYLLSRPFAPGQTGHRVPNGSQRRRRYAPPSGREMGRLPTHDNPTCAELNTRAAGRLRAALVSNSAAEWIVATRISKHRARPTADLQHPMPVMDIDGVPRLCDRFRSWASYPAWPPAEPIRPAHATSVAELDYHGRWRR